VTSLGGANGHNPGQWNRDRLNHDPVTELRPAASEKEAFTGVISFSRDSLADLEFAFRGPNLGNSKRKEGITHWRREGDSNPR
jgi:hypothetical protein